MKAAAVSCSCRRSGPSPKEFAAFGIGVARHPQVRQHDVVGQSQVVVAQRLALLRDPGHDLGRRKRTADRQVEPYLHRWLLDAARRPTIVACSDALFTQRRP